MAAKVPKPTRTQARLLRFLADEQYAAWHPGRLALVPLEKSPYGMAYFYAPAATLVALRNRGWVGYYHGSTAPGGRSGNDPFKITPAGQEALLVAEGPAQRPGAPAGVPAGGD